MSTPRHTPRLPAASSSTGSKARWCPICERVSEAALCPEHAMATLLVDAPSPSIGSIEPGQVLGGRYVIQKLIGKGGYGAVFEAHHTGTGQGVAIKTLAPGLEADAAALRRFFVEARVTSGLKHPNTVRVFDFGQDDSGLIYLAMELLSGHTLRTELKLRQKEGRVFSEREAIDVASAVTRSLGEAHAAGLVHRDLKADNVFLHHVEGDDPVIKVLDFGIVKLANSQLTMGSDAAIPGTPAYMSPEQVTRKGELDGRSDLYALGVLLYNLVTGTVPYRGADVIETLWRHVHDPVPDVRAEAKTPLSDAFVAVVTRALSKSPEDRHPDARAMRTALLACLGEGGRAGLHFDTGSDVSGSQRPLDDADQELTVDQTVPHGTPSAPLRSAGALAARGAAVRREAAPFTSEVELDRTLPAAVPGAAGVSSGPVPNAARAEAAGRSGAGVMRAVIIGLLLVVALLAGALVSRLFGREAVEPAPLARPADVAPARALAGPNSREPAAPGEPAATKAAEAAEGARPSEVEREPSRDEHPPPTAAKTDGAPASGEARDAGPAPAKAKAPARAKKEPGGDSRGKKGSDVLDIKI